MQHSPVYGDRSYQAYQVAATRPSVREVAGSKSLASMLPTILTTGVITLVVTATMRLIWAGFNNDFFAAWMEAWLTTWPIAFPIAYLTKPLVNRLTRSVSKPVAASVQRRRPGLTVADVMSASEQATHARGLRVRESVTPRY
ncbi:DUF2798 domain-containing protein [Undibacterium sp. SXout7W]|uniref:DUF2798 domain-containing protein n=1 Tax=Undibacterium sp. SXout7W TaxID=3413049 RepID=UPI003BF39CCA